MIFNLIKNNPLYQTILWNIHFLRTLPKSLYSQLLDIILSFLPMSEKKNKNKRAKIISPLLRYLLRRHPFQLSFPLTLQHPPTPLKAGFSHSEEGGGHKYISLFSPLVLNVLPPSLTSSPKSLGSSSFCS